MNAHHNSYDTPETVDPKSLRDLMVMNAAYTYFIASAGPAEKQWMAELALTRGYNQIAAMTEKILDQIAIEKGAEGLSQLLYSGRERIDYSLDRGIAVRPLSMGLEGRACRTCSVCKPANSTYRTGHRKSRNRTWPWPNSAVYPITQSGSGDRSSSVASDSVRSLLMICLLSDESTTRRHPFGVCPCPPCTGAMASAT